MDNKIPYKNLMEVYVILVNVIEKNVECGYMFIYVLKLEDFNTFLSLL